jgi:hypothetical protein
MVGFFLAVFLNFREETKKRGKIPCLVLSCLALRYVAE